MDIKENLSKNLVSFRKALGLTQVEIAEKLNYSDKSVSKWERGESIPDLMALKQIADIFGTTIDSLISEPTTNKPKTVLNLPIKRLLISLSAIALVWLIATVCFVFLGVIIPSLSNTWLSFIYAIPISSIILLVLTSVWGKRLANTIINSLLVWSLLVSIYLTIICALPNINSQIWLILLIGIPLQILIIFRFFYKKVK